MIASNGNHLHTFLSESLGLDEVTNNHLFVLVCGQLEVVAISNKKVGVLFWLALAENTLDVRDFLVREWDSNINLNRKYQHQAKNYREHTP